MSAILERNASSTLGSYAGVNEHRPAIGAVIARGLGFVRDFVAEADTHEIIEAGALLMVLGAATIFTLGAFGLHIGAN